MRSTVSIKSFILILVIFFIGVSSLFYFFLSRPKILNVRKGEMEVLGLRERVIEKSLERDRELEKLRDVMKEARVRPHKWPPSEPPGMHCVDCHLKPAPP